MLITSRYLASLSPSSLGKTAILKTSAACEVFLITKTADGSPKLLASSCPSLEQTTTSTNERADDRRIIIMIKRRMSGILIVIIISIYM